MGESVILLGFNFSTFPLLSFHALAGDRHPELEKHRTLALGKPAIKTNAPSHRISGFGLADLRYERLNMQFIKTSFYKASGF